MRYLEQTMAGPNGKIKMNNAPVIIGMACRVPGASTPSKLWENILSMKDLQRTMPGNRFNIGAFHHPDNTRKGTVSRHYYRCPTYR